MINLNQSNLVRSGPVATEKRLGPFSKIKIWLEKMSLARRTYIASALVLLFFLGGAALMLSTIFAISLESIVKERLTLHTYQLLSIGNSDSGQMQLPEQIAEPRFNQQSGSLIAFVTELAADNQQQEVWRSLSATDKQFAFPAPSSGQWYFGRAQGADGARYYVSSYNTTWSNGEGVKTKYIFTVMEELSDYQNQLARYRLAIVMGLLVFGLIFLLLQTIILRLGLSPVRRITADVEAMNKGEIDSLARQYPKELKPLTTNLNLLVENERHQRERYRDRMADLSHSLKTPLSVLRGVESDIDSQGQPVSRQVMLDTLTEQVSRMTNIVDYQLQRAISNGAPTSFTAIDVAESANDIVAALKKVYASKEIAIEMDIDEGLAFYGDENDLIELIGNLLDNAFKHAHQLVRLSASKITTDVDNPQLFLTIEDDGDGIPIAKRETILKRGVRLDSSGEGHGFGLSIVADIVNSYKGTIFIEESAAGGASFKITIPTR